VFAASIEDMISNLLIEKLGPSISEVELSFDTKSKALLPNVRGNKIQNIQLTYFAPNYSSFKVTITLENDQLYDLFGRYSAFSEVPVTTKNLRSGWVITEADVIPVKTPFSRLKGGYVTSIGDIVGMQLKRSLSTGVLIKHQDVIKPQVISKGDNVSIVYSKSNIKLRTKGVAMQSGALGDNIKIKNESTGTVVHGTVRTKNLVEVGK
jgi:flagella basal body P-ring formation protein FlgA